MDSEAIQTPGSIKLKRDLGQEAVNLALQGEWGRATEINKAILELFPDDVEAMNRLVKALIELGSYLDAGVVLNQVCEVAPYNNIAKKNRARLDQLTSDPSAINSGNSGNSGNPGAAKQAKKTAGVPQIFIEESGKSGTTILRTPVGSKEVLHISPSDQAVLSSEKNTVTARILEGQLLGTVEPKPGNRLARLMGSGNEYAAAVVAVNDQGISVMIRETFKHRSLQNVCSFPFKAKEQDPVFLKESVARFMRDEDVEADDDDEEENIIVDDEMDTGWSEDE